MINMPIRTAALSFEAISFATPSVSAGTSTSQFRLTLTIQAECKLPSVTDIAFGTTRVIQSTLSADGTVSAQCTNTTPYHIGLNAGAGSCASVATRKMTATAGSTVNYTLYRDSGATQVWGDTINTNTVSATGNGAVQSLHGLWPRARTDDAGSRRTVQHHHRRQATTRNPTQPGTNATARRNGATFRGSGNTSPSVATDISASMGHASLDVVGVQIPGEES